ncbi:MAG: cyclic peptide export ABC transporter [Bacteroidetes bacterium]|nr:cyclic peptide export ABC transporter [Bacteroidota bacterium]HET6244055.1 cyclic peptide export ABC transporter [Bacteroidia bacterium]
MRLIGFLRKEAGTAGYLYLILGLISGFANASIIKFIDFFVNEVINKKGINEATEKYILIFLGILITFFVCQRIFSKYLIGLTQNIILKTRLSILEAIRNTDYIHFQQIGKEKVFTSLTQDTEKISNAAASIVYATTYLVTVLFCLSYLAYVSLIGFALTLGIISLGIIIYSVRQNKIHAALTEARDLQNQLFKNIDELLSGFKEVKMSKEKNDDLFKNHIESTGIKTKHLASKAIISYLDNSITGQFFFFVLIGFILFYFPALTGNNEVVISYIFIILYMLGPIEGLMAVVPAITQADIALDRIAELKQKTEYFKKSEMVLDNTFTDFKSLSFNNISFSYPEKKAEKFSVGPVDLNINKGEIVFIVGGNGSGKTTFFKLLTGLYKPDSGSLQVNNEQVVSSEKYRDLFSAIYSDFYLFEKFYGMKNINETKVNEYLELMQLSDKVKFENGRFSKTDLSTGQRKRLAMILSLLEDKPILVLDEWAADQDPKFRQFFYQDLLPRLKNQGKTIIAITHDDKYFSVADNIYKMEYGKFEKF